MGAIVTARKGGRAVDLVSVDTGPLLDKVYEVVLSPSFQPNELGTLEGLRSGVDSGEARVLAVLDESGAPVGAAVCEWSEDSRVLLLAYLAVLGPYRSHGLGGRLLGHVTGALREELRPRAILAEFEHPAVYEGSAAFGDPLARLRFYARHGGRALLMPYFQPALKPGATRVFGLILGVLWLGADGAGASADTIDPELVKEFLTEYFVGTEGTLPDDEQVRLEWAALDRPEGVPLVALGDGSTIPISRVSVGG